MERRRNYVLASILTLMAFIFLLLCLVLSESSQAPLGSGPDVVIDSALLVTIVLCVSISFWATFTMGKKYGEKALFVIVLICSSVVFFFLSSFETLGLVGVEISYPGTFNNLSLAGDFFFITAVILGFSAILALVLTFHKPSINLK